MDPDAWARLLERIEHSLASPVFGWFVAVAVAGICIWAVVRIVNTRNETLTEGNRTLEQIQVHMAVSTVRQSEQVDAMRGIVAQLERIGGSLADHGRDEEGRHRGTADRLDRLLDLYRTVRESQRGERAP